MSMSGAALRGVTSLIVLGGGRLVERVLDVEQGAGAEACCRLSNGCEGCLGRRGWRAWRVYERALRSSDRPVAKDFVQVIVAWRLHQQLRP